MLGRKDTQKEKVETMIGKGSKMTGNIYSSGSIRVEGRVEGEIKSAGDLFIGEEALVIASIHCKNIIIAGEVQGNVDVVEKLEILPSGKLFGDIKMSKLIIEDGATFKGRSEARKSGKMTSLEKEEAPVEKDKEEEQ